MLPRIRRFSSVSSSTTALLVLGDVIAVVASKLRNYTKEDYTLHHPAGALGKKLLVKVENITHTGNENAVIPEGSPLRSAIVEMSSKGLSMVTIVEYEQRLKVIITDGDLHRMLECGVDVYHEIVDNVMTKLPKWINQRDGGKRTTEDEQSAHYRYAGIGRGDMCCRFYSDAGYLQSGDCWMIRLGIVERRMP